MLKKILVGYKNESNITDSHYFSRNFELEETDAANCGEILSTYFAFQNTMVVQISDDPNITLICSKEKDPKKHRFCVPLHGRTPIYGTVVIVKLEEDDFNPSNKLLSLTLKDQSDLTELFDRIADDLCDNCEDVECVPDDDSEEEEISDIIDVKTYPRKYLTTASKDVIDKRVREILESNISIKTALDQFENNILKSLAKVESFDSYDEIEGITEADEVMAYSTVVMNLFANKYGFPSNQGMFAAQALQSLSNIVMFAYSNPDTPFKENAEMIRKHYREMLIGMLS